MINHSIIARAAKLQQEFQQAEPFRHLAVDDFFDLEICRQLLADFPVFKPDNAINEFGEVGNKAVVSSIATISPCYAAVHEYINSSEFLQQISALTGIQDLLPDPSLYGGGTHENREGQSLDAHVDFNYSQDRQLHRRLNLLLYLNHEWCEDWGGSIELHSNPRDPEHKVSRAYLPLFNRAVLFETNEHSWHGFKTIHLPDDKKHLSRKCLSIYLYTRSRPSHEIVPEHGTFYIQKPLPDRFRAGCTLKEDDVTMLRDLLKERDTFIHHYQQQELEKNGIINAVSTQFEQARQALRIPAVGYVLQQGPATGFWYDNWLEPAFCVSMQALQPVIGLTLKAYLPTSAQTPIDTIVSIGDQQTRHRFNPGANVLSIQLPAPLQQNFQLAIACDQAQAMANNLEPGSKRQLALLLSAVEFRHPATTAEPPLTLLGQLRKRLA